MRLTVGLLCTLFMLGTAHAQEQLVLIQRTWTSVLTVYRECMEVKSDGAYRFEHGSVSMQDPASHQIHVGTLTEQEMIQLKALLDQPALQSLTTPTLSPAGMTVGTDVDTFWVAIGRSQRPQLLFFDSTSSSGKKFSSTRLPSLYRTEAMKPLLDWYKQMGKRKNDIDKKAAPTCSFQVRYESR